MNDTEIDSIHARIAELCDARQIARRSIEVDGDPGAAAPSRRFRLTTERAAVELDLPKRYSSGFAQGAREPRRLVDEALQGAVMLLAQGPRHHRP